VKKTLTPTFFLHTEETGQNVGGRRYLERKEERIARRKGVHDKVRIGRKGSLYSLIIKEWGHCNNLRGKAAARLWKEQYLPLTEKKS